MLAQVQTSAPMYFNKPFILVTRVGENTTNDTYHNPHQRYYEFDTMKELFYFASRSNHLLKDETPVSALRTVNYSMLHLIPTDKDDYTCPTKAEYFHNFTTALDEYKRGIRVDM